MNFHDFRGNLISKKVVDAPTFDPDHTSLSTKTEINDRIFRKSEICREFFLFSDAAFPAGFPLQEYY